MNSDLNTKPLIYSYFAFGFYIESEINLPELTSNYYTEFPKISIRLGIVPEKLTNPVFKGVRFQAAKNEFLLKVDGIATYFVRCGNEIIIEPHKNAMDSEIRLFLLGSVFGALFHQAGLLPVHGSAILYKNKAVIFSGVSGAGKSTLAATFHKAGFPVLTDDICSVSLNLNHLPLLNPGYPQFKLWADALDNLGTTNHTLEQVRKGIKKYYVPVEHLWNEKPVELAGIYIVSVKNSPGIILQAIKGIEKFNAIKNNTYRLNFLKGTLTASEHFKHTEAIAKNCFVKRLERPSKGFHLTDLMTIILEDLNTL